MTTPTNSALHMMEGQGLSDAQIVAIAAKAYAEGRMSWLGFEKDEDGIYNIPVLSGGHFQLVRAVLEAAPHKTALSHFADEVEASGEAEKQTQIALLAECRSHLPLAAASWNDDEDRTVASFHVTRILDLIKRVDAALSKVQQ